MNDKLLMKDTIGAFLTKIDPFLNVLRAQEECTDNNNNNNNKVTLFLFAFLFIICNSFLNMDVIVALIYKVVIVALIREKRKKKKFQTRGGKTTLRYTYKYIYVTLRYIKVPLCNNM